MAAPRVLPRRRPREADNSRPRVAPPGGGFRPSGRPPSPKANNASAGAIKAEECTNPWRARRSARNLPPETKTARECARPRPRAFLPPRSVPKSRRLLRRFARLFPSPPPRHRRLPRRRPKRLAPGTRASPRSVVAVTHRATDADAAEVIAVDALEARAEVALAVDGERALADAAAAAAEVSRAAAAAENETGEAEDEGGIPAESTPRRADGVDSRLSAARAADRERRTFERGEETRPRSRRRGDGEPVSAPRRVESPSPDQPTRIAGVSSTPSRRRFRRRRVGRDGDESAATALSFADQGIGGADEKAAAATSPLRGGGGAFAPPTAKGRVAAFRGPVLS